MIVRHERHIGRPDEVDDRQIVVIIDRINAGCRRFTQFFYNARWVGHGFQYEFTDRLLAFADSCLAVIDEFIFLKHPKFSPVCIYRKQSRDNVTRRGDSQWPKSSHAQSATIDHKFGPRDV